MLLLFGSARALLRGAVPGRLARRVASTAAAEDLEPVKVTIDPRLREALRLPGKQRRPRCFVRDRRAKRRCGRPSKKVPSLRLQDYSIRHEDDTVVVEPAGPLLSTQRKSRRRSRPTATPWSRGTTFLQTPTTQKH